MKNSAIPVILIIAVFSCLGASAQQKKPIPVFTADSLTSGNYKDLLTSFFHLGFNNLVGKNKELRFASNPYAVMMRADPDLAVDTSYLRYSKLRKLNFAFALKVDTSFKFNGFSSGINYALIDKRDYTIFREFLDLAEGNSAEFHQLNAAVGRKISSISDPAFLELFVTEWSKVTNDKDFTFDKLNKRVRDTVLQVARENNFTETQAALEKNEKISVRTMAQRKYDEIRESFKKRLLWTVGVSDTTYQDKFMFSNVVISTQILKGFSRPKSIHGVELDIRGAWNFLDDSLLSGKDLKRSMMRLEGGFNYVLRSRRTELSFFEFKFSAAYNRIFNVVYAGEQESLFTLNGTLRARILDDIWVPVEFRYEPETGNFFGLLSVRFNFTALKKSLMARAGL